MVSALFGVLLSNISATTLYFKHVTNFRSKQTSSCYLFYFCSPTDRKSMLNFIISRRFRLHINAFRMCILIFLSYRNVVIRPRTIPKSITPRKERQKERSVCVCVRIHSVSTRFLVTENGHLGFCCYNFSACPKLSMFAIKHFLRLHGAHFSTNDVRIFASFAMPKKSTFDIAPFLNCLPKVCLFIYLNLKRASYSQFVCRMTGLAV